MKRSISFLLSIVFVLGMAVPSFALTEYTSGDYKYIIGSVGESAIITEYAGNETHLEIPSEIDGYSVTEIYRGAFYDCDSLVEVTIPSSVVSVGNYAFSNCSSLEAVTISDGVLYLGMEAFSYCTELEKIFIPASVIDIGQFAFCACDKLGAFEVDAENKYYTSVEGVLLNKNVSKLIHYPANKTDGIYTVPSSVDTIDNYAFRSCANITSVIIPDGVKVIGYGAMCNCPILRSVTIPSTVREIGGEAFFNCPTISDVYFTGSPDNWTSIVKGAYNNDLLNARISYYYGVFSDISGELTGSGADGLETEVQLLDNNTEELIDSYVTTDNTYLFRGVAAGEYLIRALKQDCLSKEIFVSVTDKAVVQNISVSLLGDANSDGRIRPTDLIFIKKYIAGDDVDIDLDAACVSGRRHLSTVDIAYVKKFMAGSIDVFPAFEAIHRHDYQLCDILTEEGQLIERAGTFECSSCGKTFERTVNQADIGMPIVSFYGSLDGISRDNKVKVSVDYIDGEKSTSAFATLKVQGSSSSAYPKKNFTIQFYKDATLDKKLKIELFEGMGKQSKYCMKANWIDVTHARNVVSARLYRDIIFSSGIDDEQSRLANGGVIDGYPVAVFLNGDFHGLYTMNIPKDAWMLGMEGDETSKEAILMADDWSDSIALRENINSEINNGWELEHAADEDNTQWIVDSYNELIDFVNNNDGQAFRDGISDYVDIDRAIDTFIFVFAINGQDNVAKNMLWYTFDGVKWVPSMYDMDSTWGLYWNGSQFDEPGALSFNHSDVYWSNLLWYKIFYDYSDRFCERYFELRETVLSVEHIEERFSEFFDSIPDVVYKAEREKWADLPSVNEGNYEQIISFYKAHIAILDAEIEAKYNK